jgi:hypothetical protein
MYTIRDYLNYELNAILFMWHYLNHKYEILLKMV